MYVGDWVVAVGSPFLLKQSVTAGIVSCVERKGTELGMVTSPRTEYIQVGAVGDAAWGSQRVLVYPLTLSASTYHD